MSRALRVTLVLLVGIGLLAAPAAAEAFTIGLGDQKLGMWQDPRFRALGIRHVRLVVAWDQVLKGDFSRYDRWMAAAHARHAAVLLTIEHALKRPRLAPTGLQYRQVVRTLHARYPWVAAMGTWNEPNHYTQPTYHRARLTGRYYNIMLQECRGCRVVAADLLGFRNTRAWVAKFLETARRPKIWGFHNYHDANRRPRPLSETDTAALLRTVRGEIWITEAGGIVRFSERFRGGRSDERHAAFAMRRTFALARLSRRIKRVYVYQWDAERKFKRWDSGLVRANGQARPALYVVRNEINRQRRARGLRRIPPLAARPKRRLPLP
jgi:hypothetical protein